MKFAYRRDACVSDAVGAPPFAGRGDDRLGKGADDGRPAAGSGLQRAQDGAAEVVQRLCAGGLAAQVLPRPLPLVGRQVNQSDRGNEQELRFSASKFGAVSNQRPMMALLSDSLDMMNSFVNYRLSGEKRDPLCPAKT
jgi:hypothetical protein